MKQPQAPKAQWCPCGSGVTQILQLTQSDHVCALQEGTKGLGCPNCEPLASHPMNRTRGAAGITAAERSRHRSRAQSYSPGRGHPIAAAGQAVPQEQHTRDVTSAAATHPGWLVSKFQFISPGFSDKTH